MVRQKLPYYYTFQVVKQPEGLAGQGSDNWVFNCNKWEEGNERAPTETYKVNTANHAFGGCSCPAWKNNCKHLACVMHLISPQGEHMMEELWKWAWEEGTPKEKAAGGVWYKLDDIKTVEELLDDEE
jgi:hypothetical protein